MLFAEFVHDAGHPAEQLGKRHAERSDQVADVGVSAIGEQLDAAVIRKAGAEHQAQRQGRPGAGRLAAQAPFPAWQR